MNGQRIYKRSELKSVARVFPQGEMSGFEAYVRDINRSGLGFYTKSIVEVNREVTARLQFMNTSGRTIVESVTGRVVYSDPWEDAFLIGIAFKEPIQPVKNPGPFAHVEDSEISDPSK